MGNDKEEVGPRKWIGLDGIYGISSDMTERVKPGDCVFHCNAVLCKGTETS